MKPIIPPVFPWKDHTKYTYPLGLDINGACFLSGNSASEYDAQSGKIVVKGDLAAQIDTALAKIRAVLEAAGHTFNDVVSLIQYVTPGAFDEIDRLAGIFESYGIRNAVTHIVPVNRLMRRDALIEVEVITALHDQQEVMNGGAAIRVFSGQEAFVLVGDAKVASNGSIESEVARNEMLLRSLGLDWTNVSRCRLIKATSDSEELDQAAASVKAMVPALPVMPALGFARTPFSGVKILIESCVPQSDAGAARATHGGLIRQFGDFVFATGLQSEDEALGLVAQVEQIYGETAPALLAEFGMDMRHIVQTVEWLTEETLPDYRQTGASRRVFLREPYPVASGLVCSVLPNRRKVLVDLVATTI
jgi:enamine deaminase RidA (YjgF/YER057c/UK114 family)